MFAVLTSFLASRFTIVSTQALFLRPEPAILSKAISIRILPVVLTVRIVSCRQCEQISSKWLIFRNSCLMPPWWVHQKTGAERPAAGRSGWVLIVWVSPDSGNHTSPQILPCCSLIRCQLRTARRGRASFFPELVRFLTFPPFRLFILPESGA